MAGSHVTIHPGDRQGLVVPSALHCLTKKHGKHKMSNPKSQDIPGVVRSLL